MKHASLAGIGLLLLLAGSARADDESASTNLFNAGRDLMKAGDYAAACPKLEESVRLKPTVGALAKLAACEEHEKRLSSAYGRWQQAVNLARSIGDPRAPEVQEELTRIDRVVPKLLITAEGVVPADFVIQVDDLEFRSAGLGVPLPVEPGHHAIRATAANKKAWFGAADTAPDGATMTIKIPLLEEAPTAVPPPPEAKALVVPPAPVVAIPSLPERRSSPVSGMRIGGIVTTGAGFAGLAAGAIFGGLALRSRDDAHCVGTVCPDAASQSTLGSAKNLADASTVFFIAGGVLLVVGVTVWALSPSHRASATASRLLTGAW